MFVGQSLKEKGGLPQKKQLEVSKKLHNLVDNYYSWHY